MLRPAPPAVKRGCVSFLPSNDSFHSSFPVNSPTRRRSRRVIGSPGAIVTAALFMHKALEPSGFTAMVDAKKGESLLVGEGTTDSPRVSRSPIGVSQAVTAYRLN